MYLTGDDDDQRSSGSSIRRSSGHGHESNEWFFPTLWGWRDEGMTWCLGGSPLIGLRERRDMSTVEIHTKYIFQFRMYYFIDEIFIPSLHFDPKIKSGGGRWRQIIKQVRPKDRKRYCSMRWDTTPSWQQGIFAIYLDHLRINMQTNGRNFINKVICEVR
jgi:hypothetical protein